MSCFFVLYRSFILVPSQISSELMVRNLEYYVSPHFVSNKKALIPDLSCLLQAGWSYEGSILLSDQG